MIDLMAISSSQAVPSRSKPIKRNKKVSWDNRTTGAFYNAPRKAIILRRKKDLVVRIKPSSIRPINNGSSYCEYEFRKTLGTNLYIHRGELVRELVVLYSASKHVCMLASVNMLKHWLSCYRVADTKRLIAEHC